ncbi:MAG: hypothetical protein RR107_05830 [Clostridia bacterium]
MICSLLIQPPPLAVGSLRLVVYDYATNTPIANAVCCIPEINGYFLTDENGNSTVIDIPIEIADTYDSTQRKKYGEVTLFVYKKGYVDYVRFNVKVNGGVIRLVEKIYLYKSTSENLPPQVYSELPDLLWTNELIRKYKR